MANAGIDQAERSLLEQAQRQILRREIAVGRQARGELLGRPCAADVVKLGAEIGDVIVVGHLFLEPVDFGKLDRLVPGDLGLRGLHRERRVPGAAVRPVETAALRMRMAERGVDDAEIRHAEHQFVDADAGQQVVLGNEAIVGGIVEIEDIGEMRIVVGDARQHAVALVAVLRGDQAMGVVAADQRDRRRHTPPRRASSSRRTVCIAGSPPLIMKSSGVRPPKMRLLLRRCTQASASFSEYRMLSALKMPTRYDARVSASASSVRSGFFFIS